MRVNSIPPREMYYRYVHVQTEPITAVKPFQGADRVDITQEAVSFSAALKAAKEAFAKADAQGAVRAGGIQAKIAEGEYSVSAYQVAGRMLGRS